MRIIEIQKKCRKNITKTICFLSRRKALTLFMYRFGVNQTEGASVTL